ncbi:uncharacterized protein LOC122074849 [Macadamia integrifolia]|uniref:uncharacterized protein LOC122074849 n=1 Tax=Macadamia integrifolia TaxID=60698 RepID=UPI001C4ECBF5|nr:uncharacterized protein LOC122074849 [Macadamia integrifolia]
MVAVTLLSVLLCATFQFSLAFTDGLLPNGNFEQGPTSSEMKGTVVMDTHGIPNWELSGYVEYIKSGQKQGDMVMVVPEDGHAVRLGNNASIKQRVNVTRGVYYSITFTASRTCGQEEKINISASPDWGVLPIQTMYSSYGWDSYGWAFLADDNVEVDILIHNPEKEDTSSCGPLIDSVAMRTLYPPKRTNKNMLKNGGFEEGPYFVPNTTWGVLIPPNIEDEHSPLPGWMVESLKAVKFIDAEHFAVPQGRRAVELVAGKESALTQVVRTIPGKVYALEFSVGDANNLCTGSLMVEAYAGRAILKVAYESQGKGGSKHAILRFTAVSTRTRVMFLSSYYTTRSDDMATLCGPVVDDVKLLGVRKVRRS